MQTSKITTTSNKAVTKAPFQSTPPRGGDRSRTVLNRGPGLCGTAIDLLMKMGALDREGVIRPFPLHVDQGALTLAEQVIL